jgi:glyoxylase-like metal-dependent hydrolase (beta-lactamase superfamily II)
MNHNPSQLTRRGFVGSAFSGVAATGAIALGGSAIAQQPESKKPFRNPFVYKFHIGDMEAYSISDCNIAFREGLDLMWPLEDRDQMRQDMIRHGERLDSLPLYVNILVVRAGNEIALFDAGFGNVNNAQMGWLADGLASVGIEPSDVTAGFLSHAHADHLNGFVTDGKPAFPNAAVHLLPEELSFWRSPNPDFSKSKRDKNPLPNMIRDVRDRYDMLGKSLQTVKHGDELFNGRVRIESAPGHTDGHACFRIKSAGDELLHIMDLSHHSLLMFKNPDWTIAFDHNPEQSVVTRKKYWQSAAATHVRCMGFHVPWPGLGRILDNGPNSYAWWPEALNWNA